MSEQIDKTTSENSLDVVIVKNHFKPNSSERINYVESSHFRHYGKSVVDKSLYVPLSVQVAEMLGKVKSGLGTSSSVAIHSPEDYTFPDGDKGVDSWKPSPLDDRSLDIADISEMKRYLESQAEKLESTVKTSEQLELVESMKQQLKSGKALDSEKLKELGSFGDLIDKYNASLTSENS